MRRLVVAFIACLLVWSFPMAASAQLTVIQPTFKDNWLNINPPTSLLGTLSVGRIFTDDSGDLWVTAEATTSSQPPQYTDLYQFDGSVWQLMHSFGSPVSGFAEYNGIYFASSGSSLYSSVDGASWHDLLDILAPVNSNITNITITSFAFSSTNYLDISTTWSDSGATEGSPLYINMATDNLINLIKSGSTPPTSYTLPDANPGFFVGKSMIADNSGDVYIDASVSENATDLLVVNGGSAVSYNLSVSLVSLATNAQGGVWFATQDGNVVFSGPTKGNLEGTVPSLRPYAVGTGEHKNKGKCDSACLMGFNVSDGIKHHHITTRELSAIHAGKSSAWS